MEFMLVFVGFFSRANLFFLFFAEIYDFTEMYRYATYWLLQIYTTTGYGDIKATNVGEVMACVMLMILSKIQVVYKIGLLIATQTNKRTRQEAFEEKLQVIVNIAS